MIKYSAQYRCNGSFTSDYFDTKNKAISLARKMSKDTHSNAYVNKCEGDFENYQFVPNDMLLVATFKDGKRV